MLRIKKELKGLNLPWAISLGAAAYMPLHYLLFHASERDTAVLLFPDLARLVAAGGLCVCLAHAFGSEFQHQTLPLLLAQPVTRARLWLEKMAAVTLVALSLLSVFAILEACGTFWDWSRDLQFSQIVAAAFLVGVLVCSACLWTMVARSTIGGAVLSLFAGCVGALLLQTLFQFITRKWPGSLSSADPADVESLRLRTCWYAIAVGGGLLYSLATLWLGWRKFALFEVRGPSLLSMPQPTSSKTLHRGWLVMKSATPTLNLVRKELWLLRPLVKIAGFYAISWLLAASVAFGFSEAKPKIETLLDVITVFYMTAFLILAGGLSLGEEKSLGIDTWHLSLPVSVSRQCVVKLLISAATVVVFGLILPWALSAATASQISAGLQLGTASAQQIAIVACISIGAWVLSFWCSTFTQGTLRAALGGLIAITTTWLCIILALSLARKLNGSLSASLIEAINPQIATRRIWVQLIFPLAFAAGVAFLVGQSARMMRRPRPPARELRINLLVLTAVIFMLAFLAADLHNGLQY